MVIDFAFDEGPTYRLRLSGHLAEQTVSQELGFRGTLSDPVFRRELHDALDRLIFSALAAERNTR